MGYFIKLMGRSVMISLFSTCLSFIVGGNSVFSASDPVPGRNQPNDVLAPNHAQAPVHCSPLLTMKQPLLNVKVGHRFYVQKDRYSVLIGLRAGNKWHSRHRFGRRHWRATLRSLSFSPPFISLSVFFKRNLLSNRYLSNLVLYDVVLQLAFDVSMT